MPFHQGTLNADSALGLSLRGKPILVRFYVKPGLLLYIVQTMRLRFHGEPWFVCVGSIMDVNHYGEPGLVVTWLCDGGQSPWRAKFFYYMLSQPWGLDSMVSLNCLGTSSTTGLSLHIMLEQM